MIWAALQNATIGREEFEALPYLDRRLYQETAKIRFSSLDTTLVPGHPDFNLRLEINTHLRDAADYYVKHNKTRFESKDKIKIIELGASLGAISSLYISDGLYRLGYDNIELTLLDICAEPLEKTKRLDFDLQGIHNEANFAAPIELFRKVLRNAVIVKENFLATQFSPATYTLSLAPFTHHHLNIWDKKIACKELERITENLGGIIVGDLTFSYEEFVEWLKRHQTERNSQGERVPYAVESFVCLGKHQSFLRNSSTLFNQQYPEHYVFAMQKGGENV